MRERDSPRRTDRASHLQLTSNPTINCRTIPLISFTNHSTQKTPGHPSFIMRFQILSVAVLAAGAAASVAGDNDTLDKIVKDMPDCAMRCYTEAANKASCKPEDFDCLCKSLIKTPFRMGACLAREDCRAPGKPAPLSSSFGGQGTLPPWTARDTTAPLTRCPSPFPGADDALANICERMTDKPNKSEVEAASSVVAQVVATQTGVSGAGAGEVSLGMLGAAAAVAAML